ncbi:GNAT family N-acetyltransferase [Streptomyces albireticuli]|nr:GNAT family N-acetyltransferase [Streptomyces albireticuli]MCD9141268.1 GNAT family N-acetyltransferase [Streptomyces albireticuli]MCD9160771.1 GNAT family N-acetyltransferase [Streptomyces albireticuli]MCD9191172.1 GNAT family N-acetyltransferase [Streptomyces albireticuli]
MNSEDILVGLDEERRASGESSGRGGVVREYAADDSECRIVYARCAPEELDDVIQEEMARAKAQGGTLEWKLYGHDTPADLADRLTAAGFEADDRESVLVLPVDEAALASFTPEGRDIRRVTDERGLEDYAEIARALGRKNAEEERRRLAAELRDAPEAMSIHIAYVDGVPASCGRVHFRPGGPYAELAGGRTRPEHRRKGLFTALVGSRLREARERGRTHVFVDALPTSEPTLCKRGFEVVTWTRPFVYEPGS